MNEKLLKRRLVKWMKAHLVDAENEGLDELINCYGIGEVNTTRLAEDAAYDSGIISDPDAALDYSEHIIWDAAIDAGEWFEAQNNN